MGFELYSVLSISIFNLPFLGSRKPLKCQIRVKIPKIFGIRGKQKPLITLEKLGLSRVFGLAENRNFDRNRVRGRNFGSEGVQFSI